MRKGTWIGIALYHSLTVVHQRLGLVGLSLKSHQGLHRARQSQGLVTVHEFRVDGVGACPPTTHVGVALAQGGVAVHRRLELVVPEEDLGLVDRVTLALVPTLLWDRGGVLGLKLSGT